MKEREQQEIEDYMRARRDQTGFKDRGNITDLFDYYTGDHKEVRMSESIKFENVLHLTSTNQIL